MAKKKISRFVISSIFLILMIFLAVFYFSEINPNAPVKNKEAEPITIKDLNENPKDYLNKKIIVHGTAVSYEGDYTLLSEQEAEILIKSSSLKIQNEYEIEGVVRSNPALYYRYYKVDYFLEPTKIILE